MAYYKFVGGDQVIEVVGKPALDFRIRANNDLLQTGAEFKSMAALLDNKKFEAEKDFQNRPNDYARFKEMLKKQGGRVDTKGDLLRWKLQQLYDDFVIREFGGMGYRLEEKRVAGNGDSTKPAV